MQLKHLLFLLAALFLTTTFPLTLSSARTDGSPPAPSAPGRPMPGAYSLARVVLTANFDDMLAFEMFPGTKRTAAVVTQGGKIWRVPVFRPGRARLFGDLSGRIVRQAGSEQGLLAIAFSPGFATDRRVYLHYTAPYPTSDYASYLVLARYIVRNGGIDLSSEEVLLRIPHRYSNHNGGQLAFGPDGYLYYSTGDGGSGGDPEGNGQDLGTLLGKILRLDVSSAGGYRVPPDNPFSGRSGARPEIYAYGLRNPWRFSFDRRNGRLWLADVGQGAWEEVDRIVAGGNYGWNLMEGFACYAVSPCRRPDLRLPRAVYGHDQGCSITGGYVYRGRAMPELRGWYVYGDYCSGRIWGVNAYGRGDPVLLLDSGLNITSFGRLADGELVVVTFNNAIYRLRRGS